MSRWAQWGAVTNSLRNAAAVHAPPELQQIQFNYIQVNKAMSIFLNKKSRLGYPCTKNGALCCSDVWSRSCGRSLSAARYLPAVLADVVEVSQLAVNHLFGVVLEQRHPPHSVTCHNTSLNTHIHTHTRQHRSWGTEISWVCSLCGHSTLCSCSQSQSEFVNTPVAAEPRATSIAPWRQKKSHFNIY